MGWASAHIERLRRGETVSFRPHGSSMSGKVESGQLVTVAPITPEDAIHRGDIVLVTVEGRQFLHLVSAIRCGLYQISNNRGNVNGWTSAKNIHGRMISVQP